MIYFQTVKTTNLELAMGFFGGVFDIIGSSLFGISLKAGPGGLVQSLILI